MKRRWFLLAGVAAACNGREITVFEVPAKVGGAGAGGAAGSAGSVGTAGSEADGARAGAGAGGGGAGSVAGSPGAGTGGDSFGGTAGNSSAGASPEGGDGGVSSGGKPAGRPCQSSNDCDLGWRCEKDGCDATVGACEPRPVFACPSDPAPVCGCDGVTYWNDCFRRAADHTQLDFFGECRRTAYACDVGSDCALLYASCSHLLSPGDLCGHGAGTCWLLPPDCRNVPTQLGERRWRQCLGPDGPLGPCVRTCEAIDSERTHIQAHSEDPCK